MFRFSLILALFCFLFNQLKGQPAYVPLVKDSIVFKRMLSEIDKVHESELKSVSGVYKNEKKQLLEDRHTALQKIFSDGQPITDSTVIKYFQRFLEIISKANPRYNFEPVRLIISSTYQPNAASWGEGTIVYNAGLFTQLNNEAQAVFVLCHELSHYLLDHSGRRMDRHLGLLYSKETQDQLKRLKQQSFNKASELDELAKSINYSATRHSRASESQADSMAFELLKNTGYDLDESLKSLALLDSVDGYKYDHPLLLKERFSSVDFAFREAWVKKQSGLGAMATIIDKKDSIARDSLKTHPDIPFRVAAVEKMLAAQGHTSGKKFLVNEQLFVRLQHAFDFGIVDYCFKSDQVSRALLFSLQMLDAYPDSAYLYAMAGRCLQACYIKQKDHRLSNIIDRPSPFHDEVYAELLRFLNTVRLSDLGTIIDVWAQKNRARFENNEDYLFMLIQNASINDLPERTALIKKYKTQFPKGIFYHQIQ